MKRYNISFVPHKRSSIFIQKIENIIVFAKNKESAKEMGVSIVRDRCGDVYTKLYKYIIYEDK